MFGDIVNSVLDAATAVGDTVASIFSLGGGKANAVHHAFKVLLDPLLGLTAFLQSLFTREYDAWKGAEQDIKDGSAGYGEAAYAQRVAFDRLLNVIIPGSIAWLDGRTHQWVDQWIDDTFWPFYRLEGRRWDTQWSWNVWMFKWRSGWVDPNINDWRNWHAWFTGWPKQMIEWVHSWWTNPTHFSDWAVPILAWPSVHYVDHPQHRDLRDEWTEIIFDSAVDVKYHVEQAAVAVLLSEGW